MDCQDSLSSRSKQAWSHGREIGLQASLNFTNRVYTFNHHPVIMDGLSMGASWALDQLLVRIGLASLIALMRVESKAIYLD